MITIAFRQVRPTIPTLQSPCRSRPAGASRQGLHPRRRRRPRADQAPTRGPAAHRQPLLQPVAHRPAGANRTRQRPARPLACSRSRHRLPTTHRRHRRCCTRPDLTRPRKQVRKPHYDVLFPFWWTWIGSLTDSAAGVIQVSASFVLAATSPWRHRVYGWTRWVIGNGSFGPCWSRGEHPRGHDPRPRSRMSCLR
jgi:hypothetical protein